MHVLKQARKKDETKNERELKGFVENVFIKAS